MKSPCNIMFTEIHKMKRKERMTREKYALFTSKHASLGNHPQFSPVFARANAATALMLGSESVIRLNRAEMTAAV